MTDNEKSEQKEKEQHQDVELLSWYKKIEIIGIDIKSLGHQYHHHTDDDDDCTILKQLKTELAGLLKEDAKADKLRSLPLYSCRITGFRFVCSKCYDNVYNRMLVQNPMIHSNR